MSIDKIFLKQFKANNKFIDAMLSIINNYLQISDMKKLLSCCQLICDSKDMFEENNKILNELQEKMDIFRQIRSEKLLFRFKKNVYIIIYILQKFNWRWVKRKNRRCL